MRGCGESVERLDTSFTIFLEHRRSEIKGGWCPESPGHR
jgi:hypothetical protein